MAKPKIRLLDIAALLLTLVATIVQLAGFFIPNWWSYELSVSKDKEEVGMIKSTKCDAIGCTDKTAIVIEGGKEWLFITRIFEAFGVFLCLVAVVVHLIYLPTRNFTVRSAAIYTLGAAGLFILAGSFTFVALYKSLGTNLPVNNKGSAGPGFGLCIVAGVLTLVASAVTGVATVKKGDDYYE